MTRRLPVARRCARSASCCGRSRRRRSRGGSDEGPLPRQRWARRSRRRRDPLRALRGRPADASAYSDAEFALDALAVMDAARIGRAVLVSVSCGALWALRLCAEHPDRVLGSVFIAPTAPLVPPLAERRVQRFGEVIDDPVGWQTYNAHYWTTHYPEFVTFFMGRIFTEPHSTKPIEDAIGWALEIDGETLTAADRGLKCCDAAATRRLAAQLACPVLVMHGTQDAVRGYAEGEALAGCTGGPLVTLAGAGHFPHV